MTVRPHRKDDEAPEAAAASLSEAEWDRILPPIDESDPEWQAYVKKAVQESLDDPRPSLPGEEVLARIRQRHEARLKRGL